jgi:hypothetical protein
MRDLYRSDHLIETAERETGLRDFGEGAWRDGLEVLLDSAAHEAQLNEIGQHILRSWIHLRLVNRLRVVDWVKRHPEMQDQRIERPLIVLGMLRTGTTILCELLAQDPRNRPLMKWEGLDCCPPPQSATFRSDPRIRIAVEEVERTYSAVPKLKAVHYEPGDGPTECVALLGQSFRSQDWIGLFHVPSYCRWFQACDMLPAYEYHRSCLQLLQSQAPGRWSLKAPGHMLALDALMTVYPDARLIVTHRDPLKTVASSVSLSVTSRPETLTAADIDGYFGPLWLDILSTMVDRMMDYRERIGSDRFYDLHYLDFVADPIRAVQGIYDHFGETLTAEARTAMRQHLARNPKGQHGSHRYTLEDFGLSETEVHDRFARYRERFDIETE